MKIYIVDFSDSTSISDNLIGRFEVYEEKKDGGNAYKQVGEILPDIILINYEIKPSHGLQTAQSIKERKRTSNIPIYFVGKEVNANQKLKHIGQLITTDEIEKYLQP
jgi:chemotaxis response regulator CheB